MFRFASRTFANAGARMANMTGGFARPRMAVASAAVATGAIGYYGMRNECLKIEIDDATAKKLLAALQPKQSTGPRYNTLLPSPPNATVKCCVVEFNVPDIKDEAIETLIDFADYDGDGVINYAEFARVLTAEDVMRMKDTLAGNVDH